MNDDQENRRGRAGAVKAVLATYQTQVATVPALVTQQGELDDSIALIDEISQGQASPTGGITLDKENVMELMIKKALQVAGQVKAWASVVGNQTLMAKVAVSHSTFVHKRDDQRDETAQEIHDVAQENLAALADYGTTAATLSALQTRIGVYTLAVPSTGVAKGHKTTLTEELENEMRRADMIQRERLDGLMEQFSESQPMFYADYKNARKLIDATGGSGGDPKPPVTPP